MREVLTFYLGKTLDDEPGLHSLDLTILASFDCRHLRPGGKSGTFSYTSLSNGDFSSSIMADWKASRVSCFASFFPRYEFSKGTNVLGGFVGGWRASAPGTLHGFL